MSINDFINSFHFLRPAALLLLFLVPLAIWIINKYQIKRSSWQQIIPNHLLKHLQSNDSLTTLKRPLGLLACGLLIAIVAIAGPTWQKLPTLVYKNEMALVIVLDLSSSMYAKDLKPNRLTRSKHKIRDILNQRKDGTTALVVYAGDAYTVAPLTDDNATIANLLAALEPELMPVPGSRASLGVATAINLVKQSNTHSANILLLTDGISSKQQAAIETLIGNNKIPLSIIGVGTPQGAPIEKAEGGYLRDSNGAIVIPKLERKPLESLTDDAGGRYQTMTIDSTDIAWLSSENESTNKSVEDESNFDQWRDQGVWLTLPLLLISLGLFRRGWLLSVVLLIPMSLYTDQSSYASTWQNLWQTADLQGMELINNNQPDLAAEKFTDRDWQGKAYYEAGNYEAAAKAFARSESESARYNQANALALDGKLEEALELYNKELADNPENKDAQHNRDLIQKTLDQQENSQNQQQNQNGDNGDSGKSQPGNGDNDQHQNSENTEADDNNLAEDNKGNEDSSGSESQGNTSNATPQQNSENTQNSKPNNNGSEKQESPIKDADSQSSNNSEDASSGHQSETESKSPQKEASGQQDVPSSNSELHQPSPGEEGDATPNSSENTGTEQDNYSENQQAMEGWLRSIPDDPGGLLRRKFQMQQNQRATPRQSDEAW